MLLTLPWGRQDWRLFPWFLRPYGSVSISINSISFGWYSVPFRAQPIASLILFLWTWCSPPYSLQCYIEGELGPSPRYLIPSCYGRKEQGTEREGCGYAAFGLERTGRENKERVEFLCSVCIRVKRTQMYVKCIHWCSITYHERAVNNVHWTVFSFKYVIKGFIKSWISARITLTNCHRACEGFQNYCFPEGNSCCSW